MLIQILAIIKNDYTQAKLKDLYSEIFEYMEKIGINSKDIIKILKEYESVTEEKLVSTSLSKKEKIDNEIDYIIELVDKKKVVLAQKIIKNLKDILIYIEVLNDDHTKNERNRLIFKLQEELKSISKINTKKKGGRKNPDRLKNKSSADYKGEFSVAIIECTQKLRVIYLEWIKKNSEGHLQNLSNQFESIRIILENVYKKSIDNLFEYNKILDYSRKSMQLVLEEKESMKNKFLSEFNIEKVASMEKLVELLNDKKYQENSEKIYKLDSNKNVLSKLLSKIIKDKELDVYEKQLGIEKACFNYDMRWFQNNIKTSVDVKSIILHDVYNKINRALNIIIHKFIINNFIKLKKSINNEKNRSSGLAILIILFLGNDVIISTCFTIIIVNINCILIVIVM